MTLAKRLLLGSAAALVATTGAQAADLGLPVAPSVDYVQICSIGSFTGFILPGSDVCFDISGYARWQVTMNQEGNNAVNDDYDMIGQGGLNFDARTMTEFGLLRGFIGLESAGGAAAGNDTVAFGLEKAFVQVGGLTAGLTDSFFDPAFTGEALGAIGGMAGDVDHALIAYTAAFGNGFTATLSLEEDEARQNGAVSAAVATILNGGVAATAFNMYDESATMPDIVVSLRVQQAWGEARLNAALHEVDPVTATQSSEIGYAIGASAKFNVPFGYTSSIGFMGTYTQGATGYTGIATAAGGVAMPLIDMTPNLAGTGVNLTTAWVIGAGFEYGITSMLDLEVDGFYGQVDHNETGLGIAGLDLDFNTYSVRGSLAYRPVAGLEIRGGVDYVAIDGPSTGAAAIAPNTDDDMFAARLRITRSF
ncbi:MAG: porin [Devosiaceae bacterium]